MVTWKTYRGGIRPSTIARSYKKYHSDHRKYRHELVDEPKKKLIQKKFNRQMLAIKVIMGCRKTSAHKYRTKLGFKHNDVILTKKQSMLTEITSSFEGKTCKQKIMF